jgi:hypothetical protein
MPYVVTTRWMVLVHPLDFGLIKPTTTTALEVRASSQEMKDTYTFMYIYVQACLGMQVGEMRSVDIPSDEG